MGPWTGGTVGSMVDQAVARTPSTVRVAGVRHTGRCGAQELASEGWRGRGL
jgi:hypothetical protein